MQMRFIKMNFNMQLKVNGFIALLVHNPNKLAIIKMTSLPNMKLKYQQLHFSERDKNFTTQNYHTTTYLITRLWASFPWYPA